MHSILEIKNLQVQFSQEGVSTIAVNDISFSILPGSLTAIVGESGSGKSVTALSIPGLLPKTAKQSGSILFNKDGNSPVKLTSLSRTGLRNIRGNEISMIFQEPMTSLNPVLTCGAQVMETIRCHRKISAREARTETCRLFEEVGLPDAASMVNRYPHQLSGGQKQRVMIAIAMCCQPSLLIADEPTTALDVKMQKNILGLIRKLQRERNMAVLLITHDLGLVSEVADHIIVMYRGNIVEQGLTEAILGNPRHAYTKALLACRPDPANKGKRLLVLEDLLEPVQERFELHTRAPVKISGIPALSVQDLKIHFPVARNIFGRPTAYFKAVDGVSFDVAKSETVGLVGESGCGKTTLGRAILKLIKPTSGKILLEGKDITAARSQHASQRGRDLQIVFQDPYGSLNPRISIGKAILEPLEVHGLYQNKKERMEVVIDTLEKVKIPADHFKRFPHQFSGGQRQRICIARALVLDPSFIVFDESVSALDVSVQAGILNLLNELKLKHGFTSIFISHDLAVVHYISDRILVMNKGKIIEEGTADDVFYHPREEYTRELVEATPGKI